MKSMTGYGKGEASNKDITVTVEAKSVNSKGLDLRVNSPKVFNSLITKISTTVKDYIKRGKVDIYINYKLSPDVEIPICINYSAAKAYIDGIKRISAVTGKEISISMRDLLSMYDIFLREEMDFGIYENVLLEALKSALKNLDEERKKEGEKLKKDITNRLNTIEKIVKEIEEKAKEVEEKLFKTLKEKVLKLIPEIKEDTNFEKRLELEVALLAEKQDVSEEITRLKSHIKRFRELFEEDFSGKTMDFLCQEMHREINTLGVKLKEINITEPVLKVKTEIARIKEQVQNVE